MKHSIAQAAECFSFMKDYNGWNIEKQRIEYTDNHYPVHEREIWWCSLGVNVGHEQDGKHARFERPVLVVRKFSKTAVWIIPLSSKQKVGSWYCEIPVGDKKNTLLLIQLRLVSTQRFLRKVHRISIGQFRLVRRHVIRLLYAK